MLSKSYHHAGEPLNAARVLAQHPLLLKRFSLFAGMFLSRSLLPERDREIVTLRCAHRFGSEYYFGHHIVLADPLLGPEDIVRAVGPSKEWTGFERLLIEATDELADTWDLSDQSWERLSGGYAPDQMLELVMLVGFYRMTCLYVNTIGIEREPGIPGWPRERNAT
jgi:alkylhydroperoxidase family enzyme